MNLLGLGAVIRQALDGVTDFHFKRQKANKITHKLLTIK
jgi:hypothetical protein